MSSAPLVRRPTALPVPQRLAALRASSTSLSEFLVFVLEHERMALPLSSVTEIQKIGPLTMVPRAPAEVLGILSVRGRITTVIDLGRRIGVGPRSITRQSRILLVRGADEVMGVLVDEVLHVVRLRDDEIESAAVVGADLPDHVLGLGRPPARGDVSRGAARGRGSDADADHASRDAEVLVLLDPVALLRR